MTAHSAFKTYPGSLYDYTAGCYCGVLMTEPVMRKLAKLQAKHAEDVKRVLTDEAERGNVFPSMWTLHYPEGVQTTVRFIEEGADLKHRIQMGAIANPPRHEPLVFIAADMHEARVMADARYESLCDSQTLGTGVAK
jgi:hypothetical protein